MYNGTIYKYKIINGKKVARVYKKCELLSFIGLKEEIKEAKITLGSMYAGSIFRKKI